jgi:hypothetical protein
MNYWNSHRKIFKWIVVAATALIATRLFFVQQLIAAFLIFSVLFACITGLVLIVYLLDDAARAAFDWAEVCMRAFGRAARRSWESAEGIAMRRSFQFDRSGAQPLPRITTRIGREGRMLTQKSS